MTMGDRIAVMRDGRLRQVGPPGTVYNEPADRFVAAFVGSPPMSFTTWSIKRDVHGAVLLRDRYELPLGPLDAAVPDAVVVGVRPEDAVLWSEGCGLLGPLTGEVQFVEDLGREWFAGVALDPESSFGIIGVTKPLPAIGERVRFGLRPSGVYFFDPDTHRRLDPPSPHQGSAVSTAVRANA
jgi:ABC-type sugar transport system ATPase subunit